MREGQDNIVWKMLFYLFWPFGTWLFCLKEPRTKSSYLVFFLFSLLLLWHMSPAGLTDEYHDFLGILEEFNTTKITTGEFLDEVVAFFTFSDDAPKELYQDFLTWFTKLFTENYHFMFLLAAIPVAYFQLKSMQLVTNDSFFMPGFLGIIAMIAMIIPRDMIAVQNPRFTTGFWLFVCCSLYCFSQKHIKLKYLLPFLLLPAMHSGLWPALIMIGLYLIFPKNTRLLETMAIASIPFVFIDPDLFSMLNIDLNVLPSSLSKWADNYISEEAYSKFILNEGRAGFWWVDSLFQFALKILYIMLALQVIGNKNKVEINSEASGFYSFFLFIFFMINMIQFVPVMGSRYYGMWRIFVFYTWYKTFHFERKTPYYLLLIFNSWYIVNRYGYVLGGALAVNMPPDIFFTPLPYLIGEGLFY